MSSCYRFDGLRERGHVIFGHVAVVRGNGKTFPLQLCTGNFVERFVQLFFCHIEVNQIVSTHFAAESGTRDIKPVTAGIDDAVEIDAATNIVQVASA